MRKFNEIQHDRRVASQRVKTASERVKIALEIEEAEKRELELLDIEMKFFKKAFKEFAKSSSDQHVKVVDYHFMQGLTPEQIKFKVHYDVSQIRKIIKKFKKEIEAVD